MGDGETLKRLGGGRWKTADDRFSVEPQSGSWVVVDAQQTDDLGLPLVRGPFASLTAARAAITGARAGEAPVSPLAARIEQERRDPRPRRHAPGTGRKGAAQRAAPPSPPEPKPEPVREPEPAWLRALPAARRAAARELIERLTEAGLPDAGDIARIELVDHEPAVARAALQRQLQRIIERHGNDPESLAAAIVGILATSEDAELQVRWRLVDGDGRSMAPLRIGVGTGTRPPGVR